MQSRSTAFWKGARHGLKLGAIAGLIFWLGLYVVIAGLALLVPQVGERIVADFQRQSTLAAIGGILAPALLILVYAAIPGALIMGTLGVLRRNRSETLNHARPTEPTATDD